MDIGERVLCLVDPIRSIARTLAGEGRLATNYGRVIISSYPQQGNIPYLPEARLSTLCFAGPDINSLIHCAYLRAPP